MAYSIDSQRRNRSEFVGGRPALVEFLKRKWNRELDYRLIKSLWAFHNNHIAVRFVYEHYDSGNWFRSYANENWEFNETGLMIHRLASINDMPIRQENRLFHWELGPGPRDIPELEETGL